MFLLIAVAAGGVSFVANARKRRRDEEARGSLVDAALHDRSQRAHAIGRLQWQLRELKEQRDRVGPVFGATYKEGYALQLVDTRFAIARLLLADDRAEEALAEVQQTELEELFDERYSTRALLLFEARLLLRRWDDAEGTFARYPHFIEGAVLADAQARLRLGRGDADGAWAALGAAVDGEPDAMRLTRARVLAALGRSPDEVFRLLATQPRDALQAFSRRHADEPAAAVARRILDDAGPYR